MAKINLNSFIMNALAAITLVFTAQLGLAQNTGAQVSKMTSPASTENPKVEVNTVNDKDPNYWMNRFNNQVSSGASRRAFVKAVENNNWMAIDTSIAFDPNTYEETVRIYKMDYSPLTNKTGNKVYLLPERSAYLNSGAQGMEDFFKTQVNLPEAVKESAKGLPTRFVKFRVDATGKVYFNTMAYPSFDVIDEYLVRALAKMPNWVPAEHNGQPVESEIVWPVDVNRL